MQLLHHRPRRRRSYTVDRDFAQLANGTPLELAARPQKMRPQQIITRQPWASGTLQSPDADPDDDSTVQQFFAVQSFSSWKAFAMPRLIA